MFLKPIDDLLNKYTMYKVVLYGLLSLAVIALVLGSTRSLDYNPLQLLLSLIILAVVCYGSNELFAKLVKAPTNSESYFITAVILFFIFIPPSDVNSALALAAAGVLAMASKYIFAIKKKHIFNPAAFAAFVMGLAGNGGEIWWAGSTVMLPFVIILGFLVLKKIKRFRLFFTFLAVALVTIVGFQAKGGITIQEAVMEAFTSWPLIFFGTIMLTEPLTTPPTKYTQMIYAAIAGVLFGAQFQFGPIYSSPPLALLVANLYSYFAIPQVKAFLKFKRKIKAGANTYEYVFSPDKAFHFKPGQYIEWTLPHKKADMRGNRRYFTIASSPTESEIRLGVRHEQKGSSFKKKLSEITANDTLIISQLSGDFTLPEDSDKKLVFIAGGIGITPFRSMIKYLMDKGEKRSIVLFYANKTEDEISYKEVFDRAEKEIGLKTVYILSDKSKVSSSWKGKVGRLNEETILDAVPDFKTNTYFISGPNSMVDSYKSLLKKMGVPQSKIITDYFSGY